MFLVGVQKPIKKTAQFQNAKENKLYNIKIMELILLFLPLLGFIISKWLNQDPKGLLKYEVLSPAVSQNPSWHLPLVIIGLLMSFVVNLVIYSIFTIMYALSLVVDFLKWIYANIISHIWNVIKKVCLMMAEIVVMIIKIAVRYLITIPLDILIIVINSVPNTLKWNNYFKTFKVLAIGSICAGALLFIGHLLEQPLIGMISGPFVLVITLTWIVGMVSFDSHDSGKKAATFAVSVIGLILGIAAILYSMNQLDAITSWGGVFAGLWYAPSVISITIVSILLITIAFITNVGAIYINTDGANLSFKEKLKGSVFQSFNRSWSFIFQPILAFLIGAIIVTAPYLLLNNSAKVLRNQIVGPTISATGLALKQDLAKIMIASDIMAISQTEFNTVLVDIGKQYELNRKIGENSRYASYLSEAISKGISFGIVPVLSASSIQEEIDASKESKKKTAEDKISSLKNIDEEIKAATADATMSDLDRAKKIADLKIIRERIDKFTSAHISGIEATISYQEGNSFRYNLTYLLFLLAGGILSSLLIALVANIYAASVKPVYAMWTSSFLVEKVKEARSKNPYQPWVGLMLIGLLLCTSLMSNIDISSSISAGDEDNTETTLNDAAEAQRIADSLDAAVMSNSDIGSSISGDERNTETNLEGDAAEYQRIEDSIAATIIGE